MPTQLKYEKLKKYYPYCFILSIISIGGRFYSEQLEKQFAFSEFVKLAY